VYAVLYGVLLPDRAAQARPGVLAIKRYGPFHEYQAIDAGLTCNARALHALLLLAKEEYSEFSWESEVDPSMRDSDSLDLDGRAPLRDVLNTAAAIGNLTGDPNLGLKWGEKAASTHPGFLGVICSSSPTLSHALFNLTTVLSTVAEVGELCVGSSGRVVTLQLVHADRALVAERFFLDCLFSYLIRVVAVSSLESVKPVSLEVVYDRPEDEAEILRLLQEEAIYSRPYASVSYSFADLASPMRFPHQGILQAALSEARGMVKELDELAKFRRSVGLEVRNSLDKPHPTLEKVAKRMSMSRRTLQRRLDESGLSFREVLKHERHEKALVLLESSDKSIAEVSDGLGFANQSAFTRAFRGTVGLSPSEYRSRARKADGEDS